jgi:hypothetical protein
LLVSGNLVCELTGGHEPAYEFETAMGGGGLLHFFFYMVPT